MNIYTQRRPMARLAFGLVLVCSLSLFGACSPDKPKFNAIDVGGNYAKLADALNVSSARVDNPSHVAGARHWHLPAAVMRATVHRLTGCPKARATCVR